MKNLLIVLLSVISITGMAQTRLYFSGNEPSPISPSLKGSWGYTNEVGRYKLNNVKGTTIIGTGTQIGPWTSGNTAIDRQYTSTRMSAGVTFTASSTGYKMQLMVREFNNNDNTDRIALGIYVVSEDGETIRATLKTLGAGTANEFINNASYRNKSYSTSTTTITNSYTTVEGDRIVVEIGYTDNAGNTPEASAKWGENAADLPENETQTTNGAGWIQFSNNITFIGEYVLPTPALTRFTCGFECGISGSHGVLDFGASFNTNGNFIRSGNRSLHIPGGGSAIFSFAEPNSESPVSTLVLRTYIYFTVLPTANTELIRGWAYWMYMANFGDYGPGAYFNAANNSIYAGFQEGVSGNGVPVTTGQWYKIDIKLDSNGVEVKVNDVSAGLVAGSVGLEQLNISGGGDFYVDDLIVSTNLTDYPFSDGHVYPFVPTSDDNHNIAGTVDFRKTLTNVDILNTTTDAYQLVNELPIGSGGNWINMVGPPNPTDYVQCKFGPAPGFSTPIMPPNAVSVVCAVHQPSTNSGNMEIRLNDNGTTNILYSARAVAGTTFLKYVRGDYALAPSGVPWTVTNGAGNFNNLKIQFGSPSAVDVNPNQYFDGAIIEANFPSSSGPPRRVRLIQ